MNIEYEAVFAPIRKDEIRLQLEKLGAVCWRSEFLQKRINFTLPKESTYYATGWARVRDEGDKVTMSVKAITSNETIEGQNEICLEVNDFDIARDFFLALGCHEKSYQETTREIWTLDGAEIAIDEWPWLDPFVEIESENEESVRKIAKRLGFDWKRAIFGSVDVQYEKKYGVSRRVINNETPRFAFGEQCPFVDGKMDLL